MNSIDPVKYPALEVQKLIVDDIRNSLKELKDPHAAKARIVHNVRKKCKKVRALLRLLNEVLDRREFIHENTWFRDTAKPLSKVRDQEVMSQKASAIPSNGKPLSPRIKKIIKEHFADHSRKVVHQLIENGMLDHTRQRLQTALTQTRKWSKDFKQCQIEDVAAGIRDTYKKGRDSFLQLKKHPDAELFHEWRKQVKYLRHQMEALVTVWPETLQSICDELSLLSDWLGEDHDWAVFKEELHRVKELSKEEKEERCAGIDSHRLALQSQSLRLGSLLYAESPKAFAKRITRLWKSARQETSVTFSS